MIILAAFLIWAIVGFAVAFAVGKFVRFGMGSDE